MAGFVYITVSVTPSEVHILSEFSVISSKYFHSLDWDPVERLAESGAGEQFGM